MTSGHVFVAPMNENLKHTSESVQIICITLDHLLWASHHSYVTHLLVSYITSFRSTRGDEAVFTFILD